MGSYIFPKRWNQLRNFLHERIIDTMNGFIGDLDQAELRNAADVLVDVLFEEEFVTEDNALSQLDKEDED